MTESAKEAGGKGRWEPGHRRGEGRGPLRTLERVQWKGGWRPGQGEEEEEKVERKIQQNRQCLDGLSRVIETEHLGPSMRAMFLQVLRGKAVILFSGRGKEWKAKGKGSCGDSRSDVLIL